MEWKAIVAAGLIAGGSVQALAQGGPPSPPPSPAAPAAGTTDSVAASRNAREQQENYNRVVNQGVKVNNADDEQVERPRPTSTQGAAAAAAADLTVGAAVRDKNGVQIATIEGIQPDGAVVRSGDRLAKLPLDAFGKDDGGLLLGITAAEFQAAIASTSVAAEPEPEIVDATAADMTPGAVVRDIDGVPIGTVEELIESGVILLIDGKKVKLALNSFAKDETGLLIGITASELRALFNGSRSAQAGS